MEIARRLLTGVGAGLTATGAMSAVMLGAKRTGLLGKPPPQRITQRMLDRLHLRRSRDTENALVVGAHLAYGMAAGAAFGLLTRRVRLGPPVARGVAFGASVWAASYLGWVPALGLMPPPGADRRDRQVTMLLAHLVYGAVLGALVPQQRRLAA
jgi:hypothetical protein